MKPKGKEISMKLFNKDFTKVLLLGAGAIMVVKAYEDITDKIEIRKQRKEREEILKEILIYADQMLSKLEENGEPMDSYKVELFYSLQKAVNARDIDTIDWTLNIIVNDEEIKKYE